MIWIGVYCGESVWRRRSWKRYPLFRKNRDGFNIGPIVVWRED